MSRIQVIATATASQLVLRDTDGNIVIGSVPRQVIGIGNSIGGKGGVNLQAVETLADVRVTNDTGLQELYDRADTALHTLI